MRRFQAWFDGLRDDFWMWMALWSTPQTPAPVFQPQDDLEYLFADSPTYLDNPELYVTQEDFDMVTADWEAIQGDWETVIDDLDNCLVDFEC